jgi:hypothetical protein
MTLVEGGSTIVESEVDTDVETLVTVRSSVLVTTEISTRVTVGPSTVWTEVGPGIVDKTVCVKDSTCVEVLTTEIVVGTT